MNRRLKSRGSEKGIALVITLVMLAIVTVMAIVFLAMSRRERASVKVVEDLAMANYMAEAALERAKAEAVAGMAAGGSKLHYDIFNSRAFTRDFYTPQGAGVFDPNNVSYVDQDGNLLTDEDDYLRMLSNLQFDPRPPIFVQTNSQTLGSDFRFYLDFNRNRRFETNGMLPALDDRGEVIVTGAGAGAVTNLYRFVGDPEWIGILERPDLPHSETNRFIGRMAYLVLPAGKTLDLNYIHNQGHPTAADQIDVVSANSGFTRNQGVGSWEINLAAFLRELNTNNYSWHRASYRFRLNPTDVPMGESYNDARGILAFRYLGRRSFLKPAEFTLTAGNLANPANDIAIERNNVDDYSDGPLFYPGDPIFAQRTPAAFENDDPVRPWPGSVNTNGFTDIQQLFSLERYAPGLAGRLQRPMNTGLSSYDRYTFYRLASQLGADSTPAIKDKVHLNFRNAVGQITNTYVTWSSNAVEFFTNAANLMLKASIDRTVTNPVTGNVYYMIGDTPVRTNFSINNIQIIGKARMNDPWSTNNEYTPTIHRILQVAANIYDNMTNNSAASTYPYYPSVFRPLYAKTADGMIISGFQEITNGVTTLSLPWRDPGEIWMTNSMGDYSGYNFFGQHLVIGTKKGHPNFNELALQSYVEVSRKLEVVKGSGAALPPTDTNQMFIVSMLNRWGIEGWNSYTNIYSRGLSISGDIVSRVVIRDGTNMLARPVFDRLYRAANIVVTNDWPAAAAIVQESTNFLTLYDQTFPLLNNQAYSRVPVGGQYFGPTNLATFRDLDQSPQFTLYTTNDVRFWMIDTETGRIVDFVSFDNLTTMMDLTTNLYSRPNAVNQLVGGNAFNDDMFWDPTPVGGDPTVTAGITNQLAVSGGEIEVDDDTWRAYKYNTPDKRGSISKWRKFVGLSPRATDPVVGPSVETRHQAPFVPTRRMHQLITWQVNDPFVHYMPEDLTRRPNSDLPINLRISEPLPTWNIGRLNEMYRPWGGNPLEEPQNNPFVYNVGLTDPGIRRSDDWEFPIDEARVEARTNFNIFANIGSLGQVHRGTPWQTVYLKSIYQIIDGQVSPFLDPNLWKAWSGSAGTYPMQDWRLMDVFTTAQNENAARGLLSVNQTNRASWSAVLSGIAVATNSIRTSQLQGLGPHEGQSPEDAYRATMIEPASLQISNIVASINFARLNQFQVSTNPNWAANPRQQWLLVPKTNQFVNTRATVFDSVGDILSAPHLTVQSPFLNPHPKQIQHVITDRAVEYIPQQIMSLLRKDEPRFVVYAFGQALKPAPNSLSTHPRFYNLCTNYQITGEVVTKTTFRVEGELGNGANPLRAVVESYNILPPAE